MPVNCVNLVNINAQGKKLGGGGVEEKRGGDRKAEGQRSGGRGEEG